MTRVLIGSLDDPRLAPYSQLKTTNLTRWSGLFIAEGRKVVERLLASDYAVESVLVSDRQLHYLPESDLVQETPVYVLPQALAEQLVGYNFHAGILGCGRRRSTAALTDLWPLQAPRSLVVAADRITDPDNLGALIRLCSGFGASGLLLGPGCADPFSRRTLRVSMGTLLTLPVRESSNLVADLNELRRQGFVTVGAALDSRATPLSHFTSAELTCVVFGNESEGISPPVLAACDKVVIIPMSGGTDSLNVSVAAGIVLYELTRTFSLE